MHEFELRVYYEDTDLAGIVYYANYLKFIERARSEWCRCGIPTMVASQRADRTVHASSLPQRHEPPWLCTNLRARDSPTQVNRESGYPD